MKPATKFLFVFLFPVVLMGCGSQSLYLWSGYDTKMYGYYKNPVEREDFIQGLKEIIDESEPAGKVPPGIYAEYGFALFEEGNHQQAVLYYEKEAKQWPESRAFMNKLIAMAQNRAKTQKENKRPVGMTEPAVSGNAVKPLTGEITK